MKKAAIATIILMCLMMLTNTVFARSMWPEPIDARNAQLVFLKSKDEYVLLYNAYKRQPAGTTAIRANFWSTHNVYYEQIYQNPNGVLYLTCNGTYLIEYLDSSQNVIAETRQLVTTKILNPPCQSYQNQGLQNDYNLTADRDNGRTYLNWDNVPNAHRYEVYENGENLLGSTNSNTFDTNQNGNNYTVVAYDQNGNVIGTSDYYSDNINDNLDDDDGGGGEGGSCNACEKLTQLLQCPAWEDYMGELTGAIQAALPPPTNWDEVAGTFVDQFADYFGQVPAAPQINDIAQDIVPAMPVLNTEVEGSNVIPNVPTQFNDGVLNTDITTGEQIEIVNESESFEIFEPTEFIEHDPVGVFVYPNDNRNTSNGIKVPSTITTNYETPQPTQTTTPTIPDNQQPAPNVPQNPAPTPSFEPSDMPIPRSDLH